jgi:hypothetical protein
MNWREELSLLASKELSRLQDENTVLLNEVRQQITSLMDRRLSHRITRSDYAAEWKASKSNEAEFKRRVALLTSEIIRRQVSAQAVN